MISFPIEQKILNEKEFQTLKQALIYLSGQLDAPKQQKIASLSKVIIVEPSVQNIVIRTLKLILSQKSELAIFGFQQRALDLLASLFETCDAMMILLIEVYLVPILSDIASDFAKEESHQQSQRKNHKNKEQEMYERISLKSIELLLIWSTIRPKRLHQYEQMSQCSGCLNGLIKFMDDIPNSDDFLISTRSEQEICLMYGLSYKQIEKKSKTLRKKYLSRLLTYFEDNFIEVKAFSDFHMGKLLNKIKQKKYSEFSTTSLQSKKSTAQEILSEIGQDFKLNMVQNIPEIDYKVLYKTLDTYLTSPLLRTIFDILGHSQNFPEKIVCINVLTELIKWGDIEAYLIVTYSDTIQAIANRISEVKGEKSLNQGENIYPQILESAGKGKFYIQFLRFLQIFGLCIEEDLEGETETPKVKQIYENLKKIRKFIFPENLMIKRIQNQFLEAMKANMQRNAIILNAIKQNPSSMLNFPFSSCFTTSKAQSRMKTEFMRKVESIEDELQNLIYSQQPDKIKAAIQELKSFERQYENQLSQIEDEEQLNNKDFYEYLIRGQRLVYIYDKIRLLCTDFLAMNITLPQFKTKTNQILDGIRFENIQEILHSRSISRSSISQKTYLQYNNNNSFITINQLFGKQRKIKTNQMIPTYQTYKSELSEKSDGDSFMGRSIELNDETVKIQGPKFKLLDHSASYSSLNTKHNLSFGYKIKKTVSDRIESILTNMQKMCSNNNKFFTKVRSSSIKKQFKNVQKEQQKIVAPELQPSLNSIVMENELEIMNFLDCIDLEKEIIKETIFVKTFLRKDKQFEGQWKKEL